MTGGLRANPQDASYCVRLAQNAVHAAMAGKTGMPIARWHGHYVHVPIKRIKGFQLRHELALLGFP